MKEEKEIDQEEAEHLHEIYSLITKTFRLNNVPKHIAVNAMFLVILDAVAESPRKKTLFRNFAKVFIDSMNECEDET